MIVELMIAMGVLALAVSSAVIALLSANQQAAAYRALTAARCVVERNIERALSVTYNSASTPALLELTSSNGVVYDDDGGGDNLVNIFTQTAGGANSYLKGELRRTVTTEPNAQGAAIRRITFRVAFTFRGRPYNTQMTTLRSIDDF
jgi:type II secretory pathway pseudopilin PulG